MSEIKLPVVVKDDVLDLRNSNITEASKNNSIRLKREERSPSLKSVSHTALEVKHNVLGDYDQEKMEQRHINALKSLGKNQNLPPVQKTLEEKKHKFRSRTLDPRFRRSRSPNKKVTNSQSISAIKPTHIKVHHRPRSMQNFSNSPAFYAMKQIMGKENENICDFLISNSTHTEMDENVHVNEKGTMTENVVAYETKNPPFENFLINNGSGEKLYTKDSYWNDPKNLDKTLKPPLMRAKSSISSFTTRKSLQKVEKLDTKICPRCRHSISENDNDASTYVFDDVTEVTDIQPIFFAKITEKINNLTIPFEKTKLDISKFLIGYVTALIIVTLIIGVFLLLDPTPLLEFIENCFYEESSEPEIPETEESFLDIFNFSGTSLFSRMHNILDNIVDILTTKRKQTIQSEVVENNDKWWLF